VENFELGTDGPNAILVGVDDSTTAARAGWYAMGLARRQRARLIVVHVMPVTSPAAAGPAGPAVVVAELQSHREYAEQMRQRTAEMSEELGVGAEFVLAQGNPFHEIVRVADEKRADALVVGASAKAGHRFVGSLAVHLVRLGKWPVTVVP
jgi:nucleotide-binding universal stress UspA family protein